MTRPTKQKLSNIKDILAAHPKNAASLIPLLQDIQEKFGYLPEQALDQLARAIKISVNEIYGVATFYTQFRFNPPGRNTIRVCQGTACHVRGSQQILESLERQLKIKTGQTTEDGNFDLERVACLGCCALAPVVTVGDKVHAETTAKKVPSLLSKYRDNKRSKDN